MHHIYFNEMSRLMMCIFVVCGRTIYVGVLLNVIVNNNKNIIWRSDMRNVGLYCLFV